MRTALMTYDASLSENKALTHVPALVSRLRRGCIVTNKKDCR